MTEEYFVTIQQTAADGTINERPHQSDLDLKFEWAFDESYRELKDASTGR